jgi:hypothetical protein
MPSTPSGYGNAAKVKMQKVGSFFFAASRSECRSISVPLA